MSVGPVARTSAIRADGLLAAVLPPGSRSSEQRCTGRAEHAYGELRGAEAAVVADAAPVRRAEFTAGRACARRALVALGLTAVEIPRGPRGQPCWPEGVVGSITHCDGFRGAAAAAARRLASLGIDAEPHLPLPPLVAPLVSVAEDDRARAALDAAGLHGDRIVFSAKESVYKAWHPLTGLWLDFADVALTVSGLATREVLLAGADRSRSVQMTMATLTPRFTESAPLVHGLPTIVGRLAVADGLVLTAMWTVAHPAPP